MFITTDEFKYYQRQILLNEIKYEGQEKIKNTSVLIIGAGGLGCPLLLMCSGMGFGKIGIVDFDTVAIHNLHRQYLYNYDEINQPKSSLAVQKIQQRNPFVQVIEHPVLFNEENASQIIQAYDIIADGTDNFNTRYLVNDVCVNLNKPFVSGSILQWLCQVALFNYKGSKNLRHLFPEPPPPEESPSCAEAGVVNTVTTYCASIMAQMILLVAIDKADDLKNKLWQHHLFKLEQKIFNY